MPTVRQSDMARQVMVTPSPESSVEITTSARGEMQLTVKIYHEIGQVALATALKLYEEGLIEIEMIKQRMFSVKKDTTNA